VLFRSGVMTLNEIQWEWLLSGYDIIGHESLKYAHCVG
jgi:hypothetical protein